MPRVYSVSTSKEFFLTCIVHLSLYLNKEMLNLFMRPHVYIKNYNILQYCLKYNSQIVNLDLTKLAIL